MPITPVVLDTPSEKPAVESKTFPLLWMYTLNIQCPSSTSTQPGRIDGEDPVRVGVVSLEAMPMAMDGEQLWSDLFRVETDELYRMLGEVPEVETAVNAILAAIKPAQAWVEARKAAIAAAQQQQSGE